MAENSENAEQVPEQNAKKGPIIPEGEPTIPQKNEEPPPQPKARGRPKGAKDNKPRIKRVPIQQEEDDPPPPQVKAARKVEVQRKEKPPAEPDEPPAEEEEEEEEPPLPKSPRTLHRERVQQAAMERRQQARDRQEHFERVLDNFMGF